MVCLDEGIQESNVHFSLMDSNYPLKVHYPLEFPHPNTPLRNLMLACTACCCMCVDFIATVMSFWIVVKHSDILCIANWENLSKFGIYMNKDICFLSDAKLSFFLEFG